MVKKSTLSSQTDERTMWADFYNFLSSVQAEIQNDHRNGEVFDLIFGQIQKIRWTMSSIFFAQSHSIRSRIFFEMITL